MKTTVLIHNAIVAGKPIEEAILPANLRKYIVAPEAKRTVSPNEIDVPLAKFHIVDRTGSIVGLVSVSPQVETLLKQWSGLLVRNWQCQR